MQIYTQDNIHHYQDWVITGNFQILAYSPLYNFVPNLTDYSRRTSLEVGSFIFLYLQSAWNSLRNRGFATPILRLHKMKQNLETSLLCPYIYQDYYHQFIWSNASIKPVSSSQARLTLVILPCLLFCFKFVYIYD